MHVLKVFDIIIAKLFPKEMHSCMAHHQDRLRAFLYAHLCFILLLECLQNWESF